LAELEDIRLRCRELRTSAGLIEDLDRSFTSEWSLRDVMAHLASWATETRHEVETLAAGGDFDYAIAFSSPGGPVEWNHAEVLRRKKWSVEAIFDELEWETEHLADLVAALPDQLLWAEVTLPRTLGAPPQPWRVRIADAVLGACRHDHWHLTRIEAWRRSGP
jgi:hypothetical protein